MHGVVPEAVAGGLGICLAGLLATLGLVYCTRWIWLGCVSFWLTSLWIRGVVSLSFSGGSCLLPVAAVLLDSGCSLHVFYSGFSGYGAGCFLLFSALSWFSLAGWI